MKKPVILLLAAIVMAAVFTHQQWWTQHDVKSYSENEEHEEEEEELQSGAGKQLSMWFQAKAYPNPENLSAKYQAAWEQYLEIKKRTDPKHNNRIEAANWTSLGDVSTIGGRVLCLAIDPNNSNNLWVGSASGGIWRSTNGGNNWTSVPTNLPLLGVSSILVDPSNSNVIYAGTGEVYRVDTSNIGFNVWKTRGTYGIGIIKSTNGGVTWTQVLPRTTDQMFAIQKLKFDPTNSNTIYACATDGLYRSTDAGANWSKIYTNIYIKDIVINPTNTNQIVISVGNMVNSDKGIYRTTNGNNVLPTFTKITSGLPASFNGSIRFANVGSSSLLATIGISSSTAASNREIYSSSDFGANWTVVGGTTGTTTTNHCSFQFWFSHTVGINPFATDSIMFGGVGLYRYRLSNTTRTTVSGVHGDHHDIVFDPAIRGRIYVCNDGGVYRSTNGGGSWSNINSGLRATQFYASLGVSKTNPNLIVGGLQDNGQVVYNGTNWFVPGGAGGDGTTCAVHPSNNSIVLACRDAKAVKRSTNGGTSFSELTGSYWGFVGDSRTAFVTPIAFAPSDGNIVYQASDNLHKSTNAGASFSNNALGSTPPYPATTPSNYIEQRHKTAIALAVSPTNPDKVYVSTSPFAQYDNDVDNIYVTGQPNVLRTTTGNTPFSSIKGTLPDRFVMDFAISPTNDDSVFVVLGGFGTSHVYVTGNGGTTWTPMGAGLPDVPFNAIVFDPLNPKVIYAGCDFGVYVSPDRGQNWVDYNTGFWDATLVMDLQIDANNKLLAATHGKGVFRGDLYSGSTLPAKILEFTGVNRNGYNQLRWLVSDEIDVDRYELERSADGFNFLRVASKQSVGSMTVVNYSHADPVGAGASEFYYRLKVVDADGSYIYSAIVFIRTTSKTKISVQNNPFRNVIQLQYNLESDQRITASLFNTVGALLRRREFNAVAGSGVYSIYDAENYPAGLYFLKVESGGFSHTFKLVKQ